MFFCAPTVADDTAVMNEPTRRNTYHVYISNIDLTGVLALRAIQNASTTAALLEYGARVDLAAADGLTPLHEAVGEGSIAVAEMLVRVGAKVSRPLKMATRARRGGLAVNLDLKRLKPYDRRDWKGSAQTQFRWVGSEWCLGSLRWCGFLE